MTLTYPGDFAYFSRGGLVKNAPHKKVSIQTRSKPESRAPHSMGGSVLNVQSMDSAVYPVFRFSKTWRVAGDQSREKMKNDGGMVKKGLMLEKENIKMIEKKQSFWQLYCNNSTVHGFKYLTDKSVHWFERWLLYVYKLQNELHVYDCD